jgi:hypothetical protein
MGPQKITVMHCPGHQKGKTPVAGKSESRSGRARAAALWAPPAQPAAVTAALLPSPLTECVPITPVMDVSGLLKRKKNIAKEDGISLQMGK